MTDDQDPTGMSRLLAGLKESGPMPDDLNERIRASLAGEQEARLRAAQEGEDDIPTDDDTTGAQEDQEAADRAGFWSEMDQDGTGPSRRSTRAGRWVLGIAAAAVVVMGVGGIFAIRGGESSDDSAAGGASTSSAQTSGQADSESAPSAKETPAFVVTDTGTKYTQAGLGSEASALYANPGSADEYTDDTESLGSLSTAAGAKDCLSRLGSPDLQPVVIDVGYFDETPGLLIIAEPVPEGTPQAWAVTTGCETIWDGPTEVSTSD